MQSSVFQPMEQTVADMENESGLRVCIIFLMQLQKNCSGEDTCDVRVNKRTSCREGTAQRRWRTGKRGEEKTHNEGRAQKEKMK